MKYYATRISENLSRTPEGYLLAIGVSIGRTGEMEYGEEETPLEAGSDGIVRVSRDSAELFRPETIASFEGKPFTIKHPEEFVNPENWKELAKGTIQNVRRGKGDQSDDLVCDILVTDQLAISLVEEGLRGLSCGYEAEYVQTGKGSGVQKNIIGNHLALVEEGRAGDAYAINDSKGVFRMNKKVAEMMKALFGKTVDAAVADQETKEAKATAKKSKSKDSMDAGGYDELVQICKDLNDKIAGMKPKDEAKPDEPKPEEKSKDDDPMAKMEERMKALELAVQKLLEGEAGDESEEEEVAEDEPDEEAEVDDEEGEEEEAEVVGDTGDTASRAEILAPGIKMTKDVKAQALKKAYDTADGKKVIDTLTNGKPTFDSAEKVNTLFIAASEILKSVRTEQLARTKKRPTKDAFSSAIYDQDRPEVMTAEKMNELNAKKYNLK